MGAVLGHKTPSRMSDVPQHRVQTPRNLHLRQSHFNTNGLCCVTKWFSVAISTASATTPPKKARASASANVAGQTPVTQSFLTSLQVALKRQHKRCCEDHHTTAHDVVFPYLTFFHVFALSCVCLLWRKPCERAKGAHMGKDSGFVVLCSGWPQQLCRGFCARKVRCGQPPAGLQATAAFETKRRKQ